MLILILNIIVKYMYQYRVLRRKFAHQKGFNTKPIESRHTQDFYHLLMADNELSPLVITS